MAKCTYKLPEDLLHKLSTLGNKMDGISETVLKEGGEIVLEATKNELHSALSGKSTGELEKSLGLSKALVDKNGDYNVKVGFKEPRSNGESNAKIANILEYGRHGQPARPFLKKAKTKSKNKCIEKMTKVLKEEIDKA